MEAIRRDHYAQFTCLEISDPNGHERTFHNEMVLRPVKTTRGTEYVRKQRYVALEVALADGRVVCKSPVEAVRCLNRVKGSHSTRSIINSEAHNQVLHGLFKAHFEY